MTIFNYNIFSWSTLTNIIDILVVWFAVYKLLMLIRGTKAIQLLKGIFFILIIKGLSWVLNLHTVSYMMDQVLSWAIIASIVIFQPEIRRGLEHIGRAPFWELGGYEEENASAKNLINSIDDAVQYMSKRRIGALITIQMNTGLEEYIETGIPLDSDITSALLINIFIPNTPLHDGAVIIQDNKVAVAAAYLPLSESTTIPKEYGTRHRAAVGISEVTDALTIVVSEETGGVMITRNGQMMNDLSREDYLKYLNAQLNNESEKKGFLASFTKNMRNGGEQ
ncbi:diadenylate cyclase CdaA [Lactobacillus sp. YT155]|uniref:diadenylate cyclase CdaA n=1 Tax=Lactobacillus sp. YT155 TaxID=3060955 RepID=UPI00265D6D9A|nr:diadenylate cyclase CdaA [Lactobacillus sp. YT155]MDO1605062.1 diadenylate cyclase CdaA [Lactobacillus sp. YT155]